MYSPGHPLSSGSYDYEVMQQERLKQQSEQQSQQSSFKDMPKKDGHWQRKATPIGPPPVLPENPTEQQRAEHHATDQKWQRDYYNVSYSWIPDPKPEEKTKEKSLAITDRERPPMLPLPLRTSKPAKVNVQRHEAHCSICRHPDRQAIEDEFVNWSSPRATAKDFDIDFRALYRHARAYNLIAVRNRNVRGVLSLVLERAEHIATPTADAIIRGVRAFTRVNDDGQWIEPPSHVIFSSAGSGPTTDIDDEADFHHSSSHPAHPQDALDVSPISLEIDDPMRIGVLSERCRRPGTGRRAESKELSSQPQPAHLGTPDLMPQAKAAKVRHAARLATSQLTENK